MKPTFKNIAFGFLLIGLSGCATVYEVTEPKPMASSSSVPNSGNKNVVTVQVVRPHIQDAGQLLLAITLTNNSNAPIAFDTNMVSATLDNKQLKVLSYDERLKRVQAQLDRANRYGGFNYGFFGQVSRGGFGIGANIGDFDGFMDAADRQHAIDDLDRVITRGLKPSLVQPGASLTGEVAFADNMELEGLTQASLQVGVNFGMENYRYTMNVKPK